MHAFLREVKTENITTIDGVKIWFEDKSAILIRPSGTEPTIRLYAEAKNKEKKKKKNAFNSWIETRRNRPS